MACDPSELCVLNYFNVIVDLFLLAVKVRCKPMNTNSASNQNKSPDYPGGFSHAPKYRKLSRYLLVWIKKLSDSPIDHLPQVYHLRDVMVCIANLKGIS